MSKRSRAVAAVGILDGTWIMFEDTAAVLVTPEGDLKATEIKGPVAREAAERWPRIANAASIII